VLDAIGADFELIAGSPFSAGLAFLISGSTGIARRISGETATEISAA
jgi:hypothetical protein